jgi:long-chain fatty acid transport protein
MTKTLAQSLLAASCLTAVAVGNASAGGLERGGYNVDLLFDPAPITGEASAVYVNPQRDLINARDTDPRDGTMTGSGKVRDTESYWVPRVGMKVAPLQGVDCMMDYSQPWGVHINPGPNWAGANSNIETKVDSDNYSGTCSYKFQAGKGDLRFIGGLYYQEISGFKTAQAHPALPGGVFPGIPVAVSGLGTLDLDTNGWGWRAGVAYEIPEIALRASVVYNSAVDLDIKGSLDLAQAPLVPTIGGRKISVFGSAEMPQSVEMKLQSGIAPGWLAFASVKWVDWSVLQSVSFCPVGTEALGCSYGGRNFATSLDLLYRDGWTISGGVGHKFTDTISGAASITWDRGTSTGLGTQTDTWTFGAGASYTPSENLEFRLGGALGVLTKGSSGVVVSNGNAFGTDVSYDFDNDLLSAVSVSAKLKF